MMCRRNYHDFLDIMPDYFSIRHRRLVKRNVERNYYYVHPLVSTLIGDKAFKGYEHFTCISKGICLFTCFESWPADIGLADISTITDPQEIDDEFYIDLASSDLQAIQLRKRPNITKILFRLRHKFSGNYNYIKRKLTSDFSETIPVMRPVRIKRGPICYQALS